MAARRSITTARSSDTDVHSDIEEDVILDGLPGPSTSPAAAPLVRQPSGGRQSFKWRAPHNNNDRRSLVTSMDDNNKDDDADEEDDSSEESFLDSLEESRTPLLRDGDADDEFDAVSPTVGRRADYAAATHRRAGAGDANDEDPMDKRSLRRLPEERYKVAIAGVLLFIAGLSNDIVLSFVHNRLPYEDKPLPDVVFEHTPYWPWALTISEGLMMTLVITLLTLTIFHRHRWILLRRIATIGTLLYLGRCVTMFVTQVPKADPNYYCSSILPPENRTVWNIFIRGLRVLSGLGLQVNGEWTLCGDYIYSGHTVVHVTSYLFIKEYSPRRWYILHYAAMCAAAVGIFALLTSRGHYTVDVVIAYWIATRTFWEYHTLANIPMLRASQQGQNHLTKPIWFPLFRFMEANATRPVPRRYSAPFRLRLFSSF